MPLLNSGTERCALRTGTYTVGGSGPDALPIASLEYSTAVATITVPPSGPSTIQRLTASVVVRLDGEPLGIGAKLLHDGAHIEFAAIRLVFSSEDAGAAVVTSQSSAVELSDMPVAARPAAATTLASTVHARIVKVRTGEAIELGNARVVVGRDSTCDFVVTGTGVSRRHFSVTAVQGGYLLRDESANGTLINGARVAGTYLLGHGDVLLLDQEELRFELLGAAPPPPSEAAAPTAILDMSRIRRELASGTVRDAPPTLAASLEIVRGPFAGASFPIARPVCSIGRGPQNDVRVRDDSMSTNHATLLRKGAAWFVVDLRSANGTFVDGLRIAGEREVPSGSRLKLGSVEMVFRSLNSDVEAPVAKRKGSWLERLLSAFSRSRRAASD